MTRDLLTLGGKVIAAFAIAFGTHAVAQGVEVTGRIEVMHQRSNAHATTATSANVVVWLTPLSKGQPVPEPHKSQEFTLAQKDKQFVPHILVVPTGSSVNFPNLDPFFHNVFSLFNGKRFDLGLYEGNTRHVVQFDREGVSYIFCNIHPEMGAVVVSLSTPFYALSTAQGNLTLHGVPPGTYRLNVWAENVSVERLNELSLVVEISSQSAQLGTLHLVASGDVMNHHPNKFGENYSPEPKGSY